MISRPIWYDWTNLAEGVCLPHSKSFDKLLAADWYIIIDGKVNLSFAFLWNLIAPVHGVVRSSIKVDWAFPTWRSLKYSHLFGALLVIPNNVHFCDDRTVHRGIARHKQFELRVIPSSRMGHSNQPKTKSPNSNVYGTFKSVVSWARQVHIISHKIVVIVNLLWFI